MSLINKMLQDLDARQPEGARALGLPNEVRPLPPHENRLPAVLLVVLLAVLGIIFAGQQWGGWPFAAERPPALPIRSATPLPLPVTPVTPITPIPPLAPVASATPAVDTDPVQDVPPPSQGKTVQEKTVAEAVPPKAPDSKEILPLPDIETSLRLSDTLNARAEKKTERKSAAKAVVGSPNPGPAANPLRNEPRANSESTRSDAAERNSAMVSSMPLIERTDAAGSPRERADVEYRKAIAAVNLGRLPEALEGLRNALKYDGQHSASRQLMVKLLLEMKRPEEAMQALREGLQEQPAHLGWAMTLARLQVDRGDLASAWQTLEYSLPVAGSSADFQGFAAHVLQRLGRSKDSVERYQAAVQLSPREGRWWLGLGLVLDAEGRSAEAKEAFARAKQCGNLSAELNAMLDQKLR